MLVSVPVELQFITHPIIFIIIKVLANHAKHLVKLALVVLQHVQVVEIPLIYLKANAFYNVVSQIKLP